MSIVWGGGGGALTDQNTCCWHLTFPDNGRYQKLNTDNITASVHKHGINLSFERNFIMCIYE